MGEILRQAIISSEVQATQSYAPGPDEKRRGDRVRKAAKGDELPEHGRIGCEIYGKERQSVLKKYEKRHTINKIFQPINQRSSVWNKQGYPLHHQLYESASDIRLSRPNSTASLTSSSICRWAFDCKGISVAKTARIRLMWVGLYISPYSSRNVKQRTLEF